MSEQIRVLIVDDDALVRAGLSMLLAGAEDIEIAGDHAELRRIRRRVARQIGRPRAAFRAGTA